MKVRKRTRKLKSGKTKVLWEADCGFIGGKRVAPCFSTEDEAREYIAIQQERLKTYGEKSYSLTPKEMQEYGILLDKLKEAGGTFEEAVDTWIRIQKRMAEKGVLFDEVLEFWINYHKPSVKSITLETALPLFYAEKKRLGMKDTSLVALKSALQSFAVGRHDRLLDTFTIAEVKLFISSNGWMPKTQKNHLGAICNLMNWAVGEGYLHKNIFVRGSGEKKHPIELPRIVDEEITSFSPEVCEKMLYVALNSLRKTKNKNTGKYEMRYKFRQLLGYLILAMFCGIRPAELKRTSRKNISFENHSVVVRGMDAKTKNRRVITPSENALFWLELWMGLCPEGDAIIPKNFDRLWAEFRVVAGVTPWPHDVLRHTTASMHYAYHQNLAAVKALLGHSTKETTFESHYHSVQTIDGQTVSKAMAARFWNIYPPPRNSAVEPNIAAA
ncbi:MAG: site-specific integrase [Verrucomicrobiota bacterium]